MEKIVNNRLLKVAYELLDIYKELNYDYYHPEKIIKLKQNIRQYTQRKTDRRILHGDFDGYVELISCPGWVETDEDAEEWFVAKEYRPIVYSSYDCTGRLFTCWHKCKERNGKWICYHCVCADV